MSIIGESTSDVFSLASSKEHCFDVSMLNGLCESDFRLWTERWINGRTALVITTPTVERIYGTVLRAQFGSLSPIPTWYVLHCNEASKTLENVETVCKAAMENGIGRTGVLVAVGGGVCCDIVTLAASMLRRGIAHVRLPTTLIGQIDAGVGLKGGVNFGQYKNYLGTFFPPDAVAILPTLLATITRDAVKQGMAEMVKIACTSDPALFAIIERQAGRFLDSHFQTPKAPAAEAIRRAIAAMLNELRTNPFENKTFERGVDFGHTIAHHLEAATSYRLHHGFAVSIDMAFSCVLGWRLGITPAELAKRVIGLLVKIGLPIFDDALSRDLISGSFTGAIEHRGGDINLVIPTSLGSYVFVKRTEEVGSALTGEAVSWLRQAQERIHARSAFASDFALEPLTAG